MVVLAVVPQTLPKNMCAGAEYTGSAVVTPARKGRVAGVAVLCWGNNTQGQLGNGSVDFFSHATPTPILLT